eukprot:Selendium_serpulae@DN5027_c0_g1_i1.p1
MTMTLSSIAGTSTTCSPQSTRSELMLPLNFDDDERHDLGLAPPHFTQQLSVTETLYKGPKGAVYKARGTEDNANYAVKESQPSSQECMVFAILQENERPHPGVVHALGVTEQPFAGNTSMFLVLELCPTDLRTFMNNAPRIPEELVRGIFHQVLVALVFCHQKGVTHRDIKPENILIRCFQPISACICDFDSARVCRAGYDSPVGTPNYIAPEICQGQSYTDKVDMYSAGCVLRELVRKIDRPSDSAADLCRRLEQIDPAKRIDAKEAVLHEWFAAEE